MRFIVVDTAYNIYNLGIRKVALFDKSANLNSVIDDFESKCFMITKTIENEKFKLHTFSSFIRYPYLKSIEELELKNMWNINEDKIVVAVLSAEEIKNIFDKEE